MTFETETAHRHETPVVTEGEAQTGTNHTGRTGTGRRTARLTAGWSLAIGAFLMVAGGAVHGPHAPTAGEQMAIVADGATFWRVSHGLSMYGLVGIATGALALLVGRTRLTDRRSTFAAWTALAVVVPILSLLILVEYSVVPMFAEAGDVGAFDVWQTFAVTGLSHLSPVVYLALSLVAVDQIRRADRVTHSWAAGVAVVTATAGTVGAVGVGVLNVASLGPLLGVGGVLTFAWVLLFGVGLVLFERRTGTDHGRTGDSTNDGSAGHTDAGGAPR